MFCSYKAPDRDTCLWLTLWNRTVTANWVFNSLIFIVNSSEVCGIMPVGTGLLKLCDTVERTEGRLSAGIG